MAHAPSDAPPPGGRTTAVPRRARIVGFAGVVALALALVFGIPRAPSPPPSPASPDQAFVDRAGLVSPAYAWETATWLLNDPRAEIVFYIDRRPPEGDLAAWTVQAATDWKIGADKGDTGLVVFVFTEPRLVRAEVGYGLEGQLPDARVRQLIEAHLVPAFGRGAYEDGFEALIKALRDELGGDAAIARALEARVQQPSPGLVAQIPDAVRRIPQMLSATWRNFVEGGPVTRLVIVVFVAVAAGVVLLGVTMALYIVWRLVTLPRHWRTQPAPELGNGLLMRIAQAGAVEILFAGVLVGFCLGLAVLILLQAEGFLTRQGRYGGGGVTLQWPAPPR